MKGALRLLRRVLDGLYLAGGVVGAGFLLLILLIIVAQMVARWSGQVFPGSTDYAGYCMAAASFFAMAYALNRGAHIRVSLVLVKLGRHRRWAEIWCFGMASALASYFAYYAIKAVHWSHKLNDISQGLDATPIWIPQLAMAVGTTLLAVALVDNLLRLIVTGRDNIEAETVSDEHSAPGD
ncbi:MAG: TRAP transporter small permease [Kiloniellales bacterium]